MGIQAGVSCAVIVPDPARAESFNSSLSALVVQRGYRARTPLPGLSVRRLHHSWSRGLIPIRAHAVYATGLTWITRAIRQRPRDQSPRSVLAGSTRDARRAGTPVASPGTTLNKIPAATNVT